MNPVMPIIYYIHISITYVCVYDINILITLFI